MSADVQGTKCRRNIAENFNRLSKVHVRYRQTDRQMTDGWAIAIHSLKRKVPILWGDISDTNNFYDRLAKPPAYLVC